MQSQTFPVVQKEQGSVWLYALERARGVPVMDGADAELVADAVFRAHEFRSRQGASQKRMSLTLKRIELFCKGSADSVQGGSAHERQTGRSIHGPDRKSVMSCAFADL